MHCSLEGQKLLHHNQVTSHVTQFPSSEGLCQEYPVDLNSASPRHTGWTPRTRTPVIDQRATWVAANPIQGCPKRGPRRAPAPGPPPPLIRARPRQ
ncbi:hypothetical protein GCM10010174_03620 [Kutzneria viridogrisea]